MKRLVRFVANEDGIAMATVVAMIALLTLLSVVLIDQVSSESRRAGRAVTGDAVFQAAEAGINDYVAKLIDNSGYYDQCVTKGESTRKTATGVLVSHATTSASCAPGGESVWTPGVTWTYPSGKNWWTAGTGDASADTTSLRNYAYNVMIVPPSATSSRNYIDLVSTGCKVLNPGGSVLQCDTTVPQRAIEVHLRRTTPADFQFMMTSMPTSGSDAVCWASTIYGKMYSSGNIYVCGATFYGNLMAEQKVIVKSGYTNPPNVVSPSRIYDQNHPDIRTVIKNSVNISSLLASVSQVQRNAALNTPPTNGLVFDDSTASAWRLNFSSNGNFQVWKCVNSSTPEADQPYCGPDVHLNMTSLPKYSSTSSFTLAVTGDTSGFVLNTGEKGSPTSGTVWIGSDKVTYTGVTSNTSLNGAKCTTCTTGPHTHTIGEKVSMISGGITWAVPWHTGPIPQNGAIYTAQNAIISWPNAISGYNESSSDGSRTSKVNGQVTVASQQNMIIAGDIHYASEPSADGIGGTNDDVLGLVAQGNLILAKYAPDKLWFRAATMANGTWGDYACQNGPDRGSQSSLTFVGTSAYASNGGCIHGTGGYGYNDAGGLKNVYRITDDGTAPACPSTAPGCMNFNALKYLVPPYFPPLNGIETVLFREVAPSCLFNDSGVLTCG